MRKYWNNLRQTAVTHYFTKWRATWERTENHTVQGEQCPAHGRCCRLALCAFAGTVYNLRVWHNQPGPWFSSSASVWSEACGKHRMPQLVSVYKAGLQVSEARHAKARARQRARQALVSKKRISKADYGSNPSFQWLLQTATLSLLHKGQ